MKTFPMAPGPGAATAPCEDQASLLVHSWSPPGQSPSVNTMSLTPPSTKGEFQPRAEGLGHTEASS